MRKIIDFINLHKWFFVCLLLAVLLAFIRFGKGDVQQDNYVGYAKMLPNVSEISFFESRLFPGLPLLINLLTLITRNYYLSGYLITLLSFVGSYFLLFKITKSKLSFLPLVFPPIMLNLSSLIDTELPFIFLTLLGYLLIKKGKLPLAFLIIGISIWFRLAGFAVLAGILIYMILKKELPRFFINLPYFIFPVALLAVYNVHFFGFGNPFYQLFTYEALHPGRISIGIIQLGSDLIRAVRWHWYRIFLSGLGYILIYAFLWAKSLKSRDIEFWIITFIYIFTLVINLVPFLENLGRYLAPTIPIFWIIYSKSVKKLPLTILLLAVSLTIVLI